MEFLVQQNKYLMRHGLICNIIFNILTTIFHISDIIIIYFLYEKTP